MKIQNFKNTDLTSTVDAKYSYLYTNLINISLCVRQMVNGTVKIYSLAECQMHSKMRIFAAQS